MTAGEIAEHHYDHRCTLVPPTGYPILAQVSVGPDGRPVALWTRSAIDPESTSPIPAALTRYDGVHARPDTVTPIVDLPGARPLIQPLPDGEWMLVDGWCWWRPSGPEHHAVRLDADGTPLATGVLGDGITDLLADDDGTLWVGYSDEGIFGNRNWNAVGPRPLGAPGLVAWSTEFEKIWDFPWSDDYHPAHCYALNVESGSGPDTHVWACTYTDFPLISARRSASGASTAIRPTAEVSGVDGILVDGDTVAFLGSYRHPESLLTGPVDEPTTLSSSWLAQPTTAAGQQRRIVCRGSVAHLFIDADWFTFDLARSATRGG